MEKDRFEELQKYDIRRQECNYLRGDLCHLSQWLEDGYKENDGRKLVLEMISEKSNELRKESDALVDLISYKRKIWKM